MFGGAFAPLPVAQTPSTQTLHTHSTRELEKSLRTTEHRGNMGDPATQKTASPSKTCWSPGPWAGPQQGWA